MTRAISAADIARSTYLDPVEISPSEQQCDAGKVLVMLVPIAAVLLYATTARGRWHGMAMGITLVAFAAFGEMGLGIADLTLGHQMVGMLAFYGAVRVAEKPYFVCESRGELVLIGLMILPNAIIVMSETFHNIHPFVFRDFEWFQHNAFFKKQHALLHSAIAVVLGSIATSYWQGDPRLRPSPRVAIVRAFIEPACLCAVAHVLSTHQHTVPDATHAMDSSHLPTHVYIALFMDAAALAQFVACAVHISWPTSNGEPAWLGTPALTMLRLTSAFAYLCLCHFLYLVTFFQYLGCRHVLLLADADEAPVSEYTQEGLTIASETSTYLALTFLTSALTLACLVPSGKGGAAPLAVGPEAEQGFLFERTANGPAAADEKDIEASSIPSHST